MVNNFEALFKMQVALCEGWAKLFKDSFVAYENLLEQQAKILNHPSYIRLTDIIPTGASLLDHYGKRSHDVDVERV